MFLPPTLLDAILLFDATSMSTLKLWLTGNRSLQHKLAVGVTEMSLKDVRVLSSSRYPNFLGSLRALRKLSIERAGLMPYYRNIRSHISQLSPTLRKLTLRVSGAHRILDPAAAMLPGDSSTELTNASQSIAGNGGWTFAAAFPHLEALALDPNEHWTKDQFSCLPPSLTSLSSVNPPRGGIGGELSSVLPRQLLSLRVRGRHSTFPSFWANLPPHLTRLSMTFNLIFPDSLDSEVYLTSHPDIYKEIALSLPRSLTEFDGESYRQLVDVSRLPSGLTTLRTSWFSPGYDNPSLNGIRIANAFPQLTTFLAVTLTPHLLLQLPSTVHTINCRYTSPEIKPSHWPASLTNLCMTDTPSNFSTSILPLNGLTALDLGATLDLSEVTLLPRTLLDLSFARGLLSEDVEFPPNLTSFSTLGEGQWLDLEPLSSPIARTDDDDEEDENDFSTPALRATLNGRKVLRCFPYHKLPPTLTYLLLDSIIPASRLKFLPRRLRHLNVDDIFEDSDYHPYDTVEMDAMKEIFAAGSAEGVKESFDCKLLKRTSIAALLPRGLQYLSMWGDAVQSDPDAFGWGMLPPQLETLWCSPNKGLSGTTLLQIPISRMKKLSLSLVAVTDEHIKAIRSIRSLSLTPRESPALTTNVFTYVHSDALHMYSVMHLTGRIAKLIQLQQAHADDEDPSFFFKLLRPDEEVLKLLEPDDQEKLSSAS